MRLFAFMLLWAVLTPVAAHAQIAATPPTTPAPNGIPVRSDGLVGTWYPPANGKKGPAILVLGGSEGGEQGGRLLARAIASHGYGVLALAYFRAPGLPQTLQNIPLEYFDRAIAWLAALPLVDARRMGIYGVSIGGETALVVASHHPELRAVAAAVPSSVVWQGFDPVNYRSVGSTYSLGSKGVPYLPYDTSAPYTGVYALYANSLPAIRQRPAAIIPVERIGGAILLLSARADTIWPSAAMSEQVMARLAAHRFRHPHRHIAYPDAGHAAMVPPGDGTPSNRGFDNLGGTEAGNAAARTGMWHETVTFLAEHLGKTGTTGSGSRR